MADSSSPSAVNHGDESRPPASSRWRRSVLAAVVVPLAGIGLALSLLALTDDRELAETVVAYAVGALPLVALLGAAAARLNGGRLRIGGALVAVIGALVAAQFLAMIRFYLAGARGFLSLAAAPYTAEVLMVVGSLPATAWVGARAAGRRWDRGAGPALARAGLVGALVSPMVGAGLIAVKLVGGIPFLDPVVQWIVIVAVVAAFARRRDRATIS